MLDTIMEKISLEIQGWVKRQTNFIGHLAKIFGAFIFSLILVYPAIMWNSIWYVLSWNHFFISFFLEFVFAIYYISPIIRREIREFSEKNKIDELLFFGVSLEKITEYLMIRGTFRREDIEREFGIPRHLYYDMVKVMDEVGIFIRGANNERRVDVRLTKNDIVSLLSPARDTMADSPQLEKEDTEALQSGFVRSAIG